MKQQTQVVPSEIIAEAAERSFSGTAFMMATPIAGNEPDCPPPFTATRVDFSGPLVGHMTLRMSSSLLAELASNIMGEEESPSMEEQNDALGEMVNIICGVALPEIKQADEVYRIGSPRDPTASELDDSGGVEVWFSIDEGYARVTLCIDEGI